MAFVCRGRRFHAIWFGPSWLSFTLILFLFLLPIFSVSRFVDLENESFLFVSLCESLSSSIVAYFFLFIYVILALLRPQLDARIVSYVKYLPRLRMVSHPNFFLLFGQSCRTQGESVRTSVRPSPRGLLEAN